METIEAAALRLGTVVHSLPRPARHHHIISDLHTFGVDRERILAAEQGFITDSGEFVNRRVAKGIAEEANQLKDGHSLLAELFSEDVW